MARPLRIEYAGACYYITSRAQSHHKVFPEATLGRYFLNLLAQTAELFKVEILSYCLLQNEYHLVLRTHLPNLSRAMRHLNGLFTQHYNRYFHRSGPLFRGRYHAILLQEIQVGNAVTRYLHWLPTEMGLVHNPQDFRWSSCRAYLNKEIVPSWLSTHSFQQAGMTYHHYLMQGIDAATKLFFQQRRRPMIYGSPAFRIVMLEKLDRSAQVASSEIQRLLPFPSIVQIQQEVAKIFITSKEALLKIRRGYSNLPRMIAIYLARFVGIYRISEIAEAFSLRSHSAVSMVVKKVMLLMDEDRELHRQIHQISHQLRR